MTQSNPITSSWLRPAAVALLVLMGASAANAQINVDITLLRQRTIYLMYEPIMVNIRIENMSGREIELSDQGYHKWLSFKIETSPGGQLVQPREDYSLSPRVLGPGQKMEATLNITPKYLLTEFGRYRIQGSVYSRELGKYFSSTPLIFDIREGRLLWQQVVGVPEGEPGAGTMRTVSLLSHRLPENVMLYLRIEDKENGAIYCTHQLGRMVTFGVPKVEFDAGNQIHILQNIAPKSYLYTHLDLSGKVLDQKKYETAAEPPALVRDITGIVKVVGGMYLDPSAPAAEAPAPSVMDRPVPLPGETQKKKAKPEPKAP